MAVVAGAASRSALTSVPLARAAFAWCAAPLVADSLTRMDPSALQRYPLVTLPEGSGVTHLVDDWLRLAGAQTVRRLPCNHWGAIVGLLAHGHGVGLLPWSLAQALCPRQVLQVLPSNTPLGQLGYALHSRRDDVRLTGERAARTRGAACRFFSGGGVFLRSLP